MTHWSSLSCQTAASSDVLGVDEELREERRGLPGQELLQDGRGQLAPATTSMGEFP